MAQASIRIGASTQAYQQAMKQAAEQMKKLSSEYSLAAAQAKMYGNQSDVLRAKVTELTAKMETQRTTVANTKQHYSDLKTKLDETKRKHEELKGKVDAAKQAYEQSCEATGKNSDESKRLKEELNRLESQLTNTERSIGRQETALSRQETAVAQSEAALSQLELQLRDVNAELARQKFDEYADKAKKAGEAVTDAGKKMMVVTGAVTAVGTASVTTAASFETQMSKVQAISGATSADVDKMAESALYWGSNSKFSASEAASAFEYMALAGWKTEESVSAMEGILNLAAATDMDLAKASDVVTDYLSAFSMSASQATEVADLMTYAQGNSNTSAEQLAEAYKNCAANANAMGYDIQQTTGLLGIMANQGLKGSTAGTALTAVFRDMTAKMKDGAIAIGDTNVQVVDANGNYRSMTEILKEVEAATDGMGDAEKNAALMSTFTADSVKGLNLLLNAGSDEVAGFTAELYDCSGSAKETAAVMQDNLQGQITSLKSKLEGVSITIGNIFMPYVKDAVTWVSSLVEKFANLDEGTQKVIVAVAAVVAAVGPLLLIAGKLITFSASVSSGLGTLSAALAKVGFGAASAGTSTGAFSTILAAITSPVGIAVAAVAALVAGLAYVAFTNEDVKASLMEIWNTFKANLQPILEYISGTVLPDLRAAWENLMQMLQPLAEFVMGALTSAWQDILIPALEWIAGTVLPNLLTTFQNLWENVLRPLGEFIGSVLEPVISFLAETLTMLWNMVLVPLADFLMTTLMAAWDGIYTVLNVTVIPGLNLLITAFQFLWDNVLKPIVDWLTATLLPIFQTVFETVGNIFGNLKAVFQGVIDFIVGVFTLDLTTAGEGIKGIFTGLWEAIKSIFSGALEAIQQGMSAAWEAISSVVSTVWEAIRTALETVWNAISGVITAVVNGIKNTVTSVFTAVQSTVTSIWNGIKSVTTSAWNAVKTAVTTPINAAKTAVSTAINAIKSAVTSVFNGVKSTVTSVWNSIKNAIVTPINTARDTVKNAIEKIKGFFKFSWSLPHLKLPHPKISGSFSLAPPSVPHFSIEWYKNGGIMTDPTVFGGNGTTLFAGGEAGEEAILPLAPFYAQLSALLDEKFEQLQPYKIQVTVVNEMDGEVIAEKTTEIVVDNIIKEYERRR